jgi:hypothetical protein
MEWLIDNIDDIENPKKIINMGFHKGSTPGSTKNSEN